MDFPISKYLDELGPLVQENQALKIIAPTGTGKSVAIPRYLAKLDYKILISVPTIDAARSLYNYQLQLGEFSVGYAADREINYTSSTQIIYATSGHVYRLLLKKQYPCTVLFVDEVHTESTDITLILSLYMNHFENNVNVPRLLMVSATPAILPIQATVWEPNFSSPYKVHINYEDNDIPRQSLMSAAADKVKSIVSSTSTGNILVFAPGKREIKQIVDLLRESGEKYEVFSLHREVDRNEREKMFKPSAARKIIVATNVAETSITIPGIVHIVDTLLEKVSEISPAQAQRLTTTLISKDSADQRKGRVGRTTDGVCHRLISLESYQKLPQHRVAEIYRVPLTRIIIELLSAGYDPEEVLYGYRLTAQIAVDRERLKTLGLVLGDKVTEAGHFVPKLNLSVMNATLVYRWSQGLLNLKDIGVLIGCLLEADGMGGRKWSGEDDLETVVSVWVESRKIAPSSRYSWCQSNGVNHGSLRELEKKVKQVSSVVSREVGRNIDLESRFISITSEELDLARKDIRTAYSRVVYWVTGLQYRDKVGPTETDFMVDSRAVNNYIQDPPQALLICQLVEIGGKYRIPFSLRLKYDNSGAAIKSPYTTGGKTQQASASGLAALSRLGAVMTKTQKFKELLPNVYSDFTLQNSEALSSVQLLEQLYYKNAERL